jgi:magnesium-transporting ATPase (P-type)
MTTCSAHCWTATGAAAARVSPEDKLRIAQALRRRGHVVAMTGDGVNDAPALSEAAIGVAMGRSGTDVAREAADLVLLDDDFATIVAAVDQGRSTFSNVCRFLTNHLTDNGAELTPFVVWALSGGPFPLAIGVLQILALDIGTDVLPSLALGAEPPAPGCSSARRSVTTSSTGGCSPARSGCWEAVVGLAAFVAVFVTAGWRPGDDFPGGATLLAASGVTFTAVVLGQVANAFACRSTLVPAWRVGWATNRLLLGAVVAELAMLAGSCTSLRSPTCLTRRRRRWRASASRCSHPRGPCRRRVAQGGAGPGPATEMGPLALRPTRANRRRSRDPDRNTAGR